MKIVGHVPRHHDEDTCVVMNYLLFVNSHLDKPLEVVVSPGFVNVMTTGYMASVETLAAEAIGSKMQNKPSRQRFTTSINKTIKIIIIITIIINIIDSGPI